ncbi:MAG: NADH-quinone oxidoreductase subunit G, partial [Alphaproteobacteria bacterium]|nr:NADH-quinone oxidoreductase subunit G [Alphaproteobacteria bacterium]
DQADVEAMYALKGLMTALGSAHLDCRQDGAKLPAGPRAAYLFNTGIAGIEKADAILLIGTDPRREAPMVNARIRKRFLRGGVRIGAVGERARLTYKYDYLGAGPETLAEIAAGSHSFAAALKGASRPMLVLGQGALARVDGEAVLELARRIAEQCNMVREDWNGFNVLHTAAARVGGLDLGFVPGPGGRDLAGILAGCRDGSIGAVYLLAADEIDMAALGKAFVVYQGHHGDRGAHRADVVLPGAAYTEKDATYVNTEGRVQMTRRAVFPPGEAKEDWSILRALSARLGKALPYDDAAALRRTLYAEIPHLAALDVLPKAAWGGFGKAGTAERAPFASPIADYWLTDPISRASATMAECSRVQAASSRTGTHA